MHGSICHMFSRIPLASTFFPTIVSPLQCHENNLLIKLYVTFVVCSEVLDSDLKFPILLSLWLPTLCNWLYNLWMCMYVWVNVWSLSNQHACVCVCVFLPVSSPSLSHSDSDLFYSLHHHWEHMYMNASLCSGELNSFSNNPTSFCMHLVVPLVLYEPCLPAKAAQAWWNGHFLLLAAIILAEHTEPPQPQVDDC